MIGADVFDLRYEVLRSIKTFEEGILPLSQDLASHRERIVELLQKDLCEFCTESANTMKERARKELPGIDMRQCNWDATNQKSVLGLGVLGVVYQGVYCGEQVAIKTLKNCSEAELEELRTDVCIHNKISALSGVIRLFGADLTNNHIENRCIVMELADGSLHDALYKKVPCLQWNLPMKLNIMLQIADTMVYIHRLKIIHRDIKPANIMIFGANSSSAHITAKLSDIGLAKTYQDSGFSALSSSAQGELLYMAPELQQSK